MNLEALRASESANNARKSAEQLIEFYKRIVGLDDLRTRRVKAGMEKFLAIAISANSPEKAVSAVFFLLLKIQSHIAPLRSYILKRLQPAVKHSSANIISNGAQATLGSGIIYKRGGCGETMTFLLWP